jgi:hypothetical protein
MMDMGKGTFNVMTILQFVIVIGILIAGLVAAESFGSGIAKSARSYITKKGNAVKKGMQTKTKEAWQRSMPARIYGGISTGINDRLEDLSAKGKLGKVAAVGLKLFGVGALVNGVTKITGGVESQIKNAEKKYKNEDPKRLHKILPGVINSAEQAAILKILNDKGKMKKSEYDLANKLFSKFGMQKDINDMNKKNPQWVDKFEKAASAFNSAMNNFKLVQGSGDPIKIENALKELVKAKSDYDPILNEKVAPKSKEEVNNMNFEFEGGDGKLDVEKVGAYSYLLSTLTADRAMEQIKKLSPENQASVVKSLVEASAPGGSPFEKIRHLRNKGWAKALNGSPWAAQYGFTMDNLVDHANATGLFSKEAGDAKKELNLIRRDQAKIIRDERARIEKADVVDRETIAKDVQVKIKNAREKMESARVIYHKKLAAQTQAGAASKNSKAYDKFGEEAADIDTGSLDATPVATPAKEEESAPKNDANNKSK